MTWSAFLARYAAQGRDMADGYAPGDFDGMSDDDRARARSMMLARALQGDTIDLSGLRHIGEAGAVAALEAAADAVTRLGWRDDIVRHEVLFELTGQPSHLTDLAPYLDGRDRQAQERAASALAWYVLPTAAEPFLLDRIGDGRQFCRLCKRGSRCSCAPCATSCASRRISTSFAG